MTDPGRGRPMTDSGRRRLLTVLLLVASLAFAFGAEWVSIRTGMPENHLIDLASGLAYLLTGVVAVNRRPGSRAGPLLLAIGATGFCGNYVNLGLPVVMSILILVNQMSVPLLVYLVLAYPGNRRLTPLDWLAVGAITAVDLAAGLTLALTLRPYTLWPDPAVAQFAYQAPDMTALVLAPLTGLALWQRRRRRCRARSRGRTGPRRNPPRSPRPRRSGAGRARAAG